MGVVLSIDAIFPEGFTFPSPFLNIIVHDHASFEITQIPDSHNIVTAFLRLLSNLCPND